MQGNTSEYVDGDVVARAKAAEDAARERCQKSKLIVDQSMDILDRAEKRIGDSHRRLAKRTVAPVLPRR